MITPVPMIIRMLQEKMLFASCSCFLPRQTEMGTAEPTPIRSDNAKLMMTKGMARLIAAKAVAPRNWPTRMPSKVWYRADASMLTMPGIDAIRKSFTGVVFAKKVVERMESPFYLFLLKILS